jgi:hypothetical protein
MSDILAAILAVSSFAAPQPTLSRGLLVNYGSQQVVLANFAYHGYDRAPTHGCGLASISPAMLGRLAWVSVDGVKWIGPCLVVDVVGRDAAFDSIFGRHEIAEIPRWMAQALGFEHGHAGFVSFSQCPPHSVSGAQPYAPARETWRWPWAPEPYRSYPAQELPESCL